MLQAYSIGYDSGEQYDEYADPDWWRKVSRTYQESMVKTLKDWGVTGCVVDCGAGWGIFVESMIRSGFDARGVELSHKQVLYAQQRGLPLQQGDLGSLTGLDKQVSAITMFAVFEHLVDHDAVLSDAHRLLRDDGLLITAHPTAACFSLVGNILRLGNKRKPLPYLAGAFAAPWHTVLFSTKGTEQMISRNGFRLLEIHPAPTGRFGGIHGAIQILLDHANKIGWKILRARWPLVTTHIFIFKKV
jgi:2-polyprenyl-3-methyl-5-hydroxy-6-metoxy-1,4-benzoquinol methylase